MVWHTALIASVVSALAAPVPANKASWTVDWGNTRCTLQRNAAPGDVTFAIWRTPGTLSLSLVVAGDFRNRGRLAKPVSILLDGVPFPAAAMAQQGLLMPGRDEGLTIGPLDERFLDLLANARALRVVRDGEVVLDTSIKTTARAVGALRACENNALSTWGIDPVARAALRSQPRPLAALASYIKHTDYPESALRKRVSGRVVVRLSVGTDGKVGQCAVVVSSTIAALDAQSCTVLAERARFAPAMDANGRPVVAPVVSQITWLPF